MIYMTVTNAGLIARNTTPPSLDVGCFILRFTYTVYPDLKIDFIFLCKMHVVCKQTALLCIKNISLENLSFAMCFRTPSTH